MRDQTRLFKDVCIKFQLSYQIKNFLSLRQNMKEFFCRRLVIIAIRKFISEVSGVLDAYSAPGYKVLTPAPGMISDLRKWMYFYS